MAEFTIVTVKKKPIRLGQFLKLANHVQDGLEAKIRIQNGEVTVNGQCDTRRGRQMAEGDLVSLEGKMYKVSYVFTE